MALYQSDGLRISTYANGDTPYIKEGYWWIGNTNLNVKAEGVDGIDGTPASPVYTIELSNDNATIGTDADGNSKKQLAIDGQYVMTEDGANWAEQSDALAQFVIDHQSLDGLTTDENGKTDAVASVSINVTPFIEAVTDCMNQAAAQ